MNLMLVFAVVVVMALLAWRKVGILTWVTAWWLAIFSLLRFGFAAPIPSSVLFVYMGIVTLVLLVYAVSDRERQKQFFGPLVRFATQRRYTLPLIVLILVIPALVAARVYVEMTAPPSAPFFGRTVHPANPDSISVADTDYNLTTLDNPLRPLETSDPDAFQRHLARGREIYYENCFYCHGDEMTGVGHFAYGLSPLPTDLRENIPQLQESFLFWRISKGAPGLPEEGGPWESAMPAWEKFLTEEEMWQVILFLYDFTETRPRARTDISEH